MVLIDAQRSASYSGMVPGCVAGMYTSDETQIDLVALAAASHVDFVHGAVTDLCLATKTVTYQQVVVGAADTDDGSDGVNDPQKPSPLVVPFDVISMDVGSSSRDLHAVPGAARFCIPTRPIHRLVARLEEARRRMLQDASEGPASFQDPHMVVVGGGAAGLELAFAIMARWRVDFPRAECTVVNAAPNLLDFSGNVGTPGGQEEKLQEVLSEKRIRVLNECVVREVGEDFVVVTGAQGTEARHIPATHCIWAAGAGPTPLAQKLLQKRTMQLQMSDNDGENPSKALDMTEDGWIEVGTTLQSTSHPFVFAAGDCASIRLFEDSDELLGALQGPHEKGTRRVVPKAGVYAVRAGPILIENLTRYLERLRDPGAPGQSDPVEAPKPPSPLVKYHPQDDFLKLVVCGREEALGFRFGLAIRGRWVWKLKDRIDRTFMDLFRVESQVGRDDGGDKGLVTSTRYDTSQYDSSIDADPSLRTLEPHDAAVLLQRQDEDVDFLLAWKVLRTMASDGDYREAVLTQ